MTSEHGDDADDGIAGVRAGRGTGELLDVREVAARLGVGERHVRRLVAERRIPYIKWGHLLRFDPNDVVRWVETQRVEVRSFAPRTSSR